MEDINKDFHLLTSIIGELPLQLDKKTLQKLAHVIQVSDEAVLKYTKPFIFTQFAKIVINPVNHEKHDLILEIITCLTIFIERVPPDYLNQHNIFVALTSILGKEFTPSEIPEELKIATLRCMIKLSSSTPMIAKQKLYIKMNTPLLGKSIFLASQIARKDSFIKVRITALEFILEICQLSNIFEKELIFRQQIADVVMFFLPGIVSAIQEIALGTVIQNHEVTEIAIEIWGRLLALVMEDLEIGSPEDIDQRILNLMNSINDAGEFIEEVPFDWKKDGKEGLIKHLERSQRNPDWFLKTANKVVLLMPFIKSLCLNNHVSVRKKLIIACSLILRTSFDHMKPCVPFLVEILIILSQDSNEDICKLSTKYLNEFIGKHGINLFSHIVEETFHSQISELPSLIMHSDEDKLNIGLNSILGTLKLFKNDDLFTLDTNERLIDALTTVIEIDVKNVSLAESYSKKIFDLTEARNEIPFKRITDFTGVVLQKIRHICLMIGSSKDSQTVCDMLFNRMQNGPHRLESTLLLNYVLESLSENTNNIKGDILRYLYYDNIWYLPITTRPRKSKGDDYKSKYYSDYTPGLYEGAMEVRVIDIDDIDDDDEDIINLGEYCSSINEARFNVMLMSLQTETVGIFAENMGEAFRPFFFKFLYLVLERYRHESLVLQNSAMKTVNKLMKYSNASTFPEFIDLNSDYLIYNVQIKLGHISRYSFDPSNAGVLNVVALIIENCSKLECLQYFIEIIDNVQPFDFKNDLVIHSLLNVFHAFVENVSKLVFHPKIEERKGEKKKLNLYEKMENLLNNLEENRKLHEKIYEINDNDNDNDTDNIEENIEEETKPELPKYINISTKLIRYCLNLLNSNSEKHKLKALDVVNVGVVALSDYEDVLLPIIHEIWAPLLRKIQSINEDRFRLLIKAFKMLCTLADLGKDFIRQRTVQSVLPVIFNYLKEAANCYKKVKPVDYKFTQAFKFQLEILNNLGKLSNDLQISEKDKLLVMVAAAQYLSYDNPQELQTAARMLYLDLFSTDKYGVVYFLAHVWPIKMFENNSDIDCIFDEKCKANVLLLEEAIRGNID